MEKLVVIAFSAIGTGFFFSATVFLLSLVFGSLSALVAPLFIGGAIIGAYNGLEA